MAKDNLTAGIAAELDKAKRASDDALKGILESWTDAIKQMNDIGSGMGTGLVSGLTNIASAGETMKSFLEPSVTLTKGLAEVLDAGGTAAQATVPGIQAFGGALNTAMGAVGLVATVVTTLISVFEELTKADAAYQALADGAEEFKSKCEQSTIAQQQSLAVTQAQGPVAQGLVDKIKGLTDAQGNLTGSQAECAQAVAQLNQMYPGLNLQLDANTGKLNMSAAQMAENISRMQEMAEAEAMQSQYAKLVEQKVEAELNRKVALDKVKEALVEQGKITQEQAKNMDEATVATLAQNEAIKFAGVSTMLLGSNTVAALEAYKEYDDALGNTEQQLGTLTTMMGEEAQAQAASTQAKGEAASAVRNLTELEAAALVAKQENNQALSDEEANALETWKGANQAKYDAMVAANELEKQLYDQKLSYTQDAFTNVQEAMNEAEVLSVEQMITNLKANQAAMEAWTENQRILTENGLGGLVETFSQMGPQGFAQAQYLVDQLQSGADMGELIEALGYDMDEVNARAQAFDYEEAYNASKGMVDSSAAGMAANDALLAASEQQVEDSIGKMSAMIGEDGPFYYLGMGIINRLTRGMRTMQDKLYSVTDGIISGLKDRMKVNGTVSVTGSGPTARIRVSWYDKGGLFNFPQLIGIAERRPEFVGAAEDLESFISKSVNNAFVRIDPALLCDIGNLGGATAHSGDTVNFSPRVVINTQKLTDAELRRATDYVSREFARVLPGRKAGRIS